MAQLRANGHDVRSIDQSLMGADDSDVLKLANLAETILITQDKDFGGLTIHRSLSAQGIILLKLAALSLTNTDLR